MSPEIVELAVGITAAIVALVVILVWLMRRGPRPRNTYLREAKNGPPRVPRPKPKPAPPPFSRMRKGGYNPPPKGRRPDPSPPGPPPRDVFPRGGPDGKGGPMPLAPSHNAFTLNTKLAITVAPDGTVRGAELFGTTILNETD